MTAKVKINGKRGGFALVDDEDFEKLNKWKWHKNIRGYVVGYVNRKKIFLHRFIVEVPKGLFIDHINHDPLDNRKENLRICTGRQNSYNQKPIRKNNKSGFKGVFWKENHKKWYAVIGIDNTKKYLGFFDDKVKAAKAYDNAAKKLHGKFASLNFNQRS